MRWCPIQHCTCCQRYRTVQTEGHITTGPKKDDEYFHERNERPDWRESYYFNWVDTKTRVSGFSTIGLLPNDAKREFVFALFYDDKREVHFNEPSGSVPEDMAAALSDARLSYELVNPLKTWTISYRSKVMDVDLKWTGRFPAFDFGSGSGTSWAGHFEQSGKVAGEVRFADGRTVKIRGLGERDKSWGARDWHIEGWYALHAQFDEFSIGLRRDVVGGRALSSGGIVTKTTHSRVLRVDLDTQFADKPLRMPVGSVTRISGEGGMTYTLHSRPISPTSFTRFARAFPGGSTELFEEMAIHTCDETGETGTGLIEWLLTHPKETQAPA